MTTTFLLLICFLLTSHWNQGLVCIFQLMIFVIAVSFDFTHWVVAASWYLMYRRMHLHCMSHKYKHNILVPVELRMGRAIHLLGRSCCQKQNKDNNLLVKHLRSSASICLNLLLHNSSQDMPFYWFWDERGIEFPRMGKTLGATIFSYSYTCVVFFQMEKGISLVWPSIMITTLYSPFIWHWRYYFYPPGCMPQHSQLTVIAWQDYRSVWACIQL